MQGEGKMSKQTCNNKKVSSNSELIIAILAVIVIFIVCKFAFKQIVGRNLKITLETYVESVEDRDVDALIDDLFLPEYLDALLDNNKITEKEIRNFYQEKYDSVLSQLSDMIENNTAVNPQHTPVFYDLEDSVYFNSDEIHELNNELEKMGYRGDKIEDAVEVWIQFTIKESSDGSSTTHILLEPQYLKLVKTKKTWYILEIE